MTIRYGNDGGGRADFAEHCDDCPLRERCTTSSSGRSVTIHPKEAILQQAKTAQADPERRHATLGASFTNGHWTITTT